MEDNTSDELPQVTWSDLRNQFGYEVVAHSCKLCGDVTYRDDENWSRVPNIRLCDSSGEEKSVFFDSHRLIPDSLYIGDYVQIRSPRLHRFADKQEGIRVDAAEDVLSVTRPASLPGATRVAYARRMKDKGNVWAGMEEWEKALDNYCAGAELLTSLVVGVELEARAVRATCLSNASLCHLKLRQWDAALEAGEAALACIGEGGPGTGSIEGENEQVRALSVARSKVLFRMATAHEKKADYKWALECAHAARQAALGDHAVEALCTHLEQLVAQEGKGVTQLMRERRLRVRLPGMLEGFGYRPSLFDQDADAHCIETGCCVDAATLCAQNHSNVKLRRHVLYTVQDVFALDTHVREKLMRSNLGIKTYFYLATTFRGPPHAAVKAIDSSGVHTIQFCRTKTSGSHSELSPVKPFSSKAAVILVVSLLPALLPLWLYWFLWVFYMVGLGAVSDWVARVYVDCQGAVNISALSPEMQFMWNILASPENYPIATTGNDRRREYDVFDGVLAALAEAKPAACSSKEKKEASVTAVSRVRALLVY